MERSGMEAPYDGAYVVYVKEAWSGGQQATIGCTNEITCALYAPNQGA